ncbi:hypothetical protein QTP86_005843 [Hemibagrus guttatus]|nr:hypothetical protein QTP86_005843 [Hemibagrus guttatus]
MVKAASYNVRKAVKEAKQRYRRKLESQLQKSDSRSLWQGLKTLTDYKAPTSNMSNVDVSLADELNTFYARLEAAANDANANANANANAIANAKANANGCRQEENAKHICHTPETHSSSPSMISAFNAIIPSTLNTKLEDLGLSSSLCQWISNFLTGRPQAVRMGRHVSATLTLSTGAPQGCVLSPLLYTHDCVATTNSTTVIKFADGTVVVGLNSDNNEMAYLEVIRNLENWCQRNNLLLNIRPVIVLSHQHRDEKGLAVSLPPKILERPDCPLSKRCWTKARKIVKDLSHPNNGSFSLLQSGKRFHSLKANTERLRRSFFPQAITRTPPQRGWNDPVLLAVFHEGLRPALQVEMACWDSNTTQSNYITTAIQLDNLLRQQYHGPRPRSEPRHHEEDRSLREEGPEPMQPHHARVSLGE